MKAEALKTWTTNEGTVAELDKERPTLHLEMQLCSVLCGR